MSKLKQVLPSTRIIPRLKLTDEQLERITAIALRGYRGGCKTDDIVDAELGMPMDVMLCGTKVEQAAAWYVSDRHYQMDLPRFRDLVSGSAGEDGRLKRAIDELSELLGSDARPPFAQMKSLYCYGDAGATDLDGNPSREEYERRCSREDEWDAEYSAAKVKRALEVWQGLMNQLVGSVPAGRPPLEAERQFVGTLASCWTRDLGAKLTNSRNQNYSDEGSRSGQQGLFVEFVYAAAEVIPAEYRPAKWDNAIRSVIDLRKDKSRRK